MTNILYAVAVLGSLGAIFGLVLAVASKKFAVKVDEREAEVLAALPGANCGSCGYPGCAGYAAAVVKGEAAPDRCNPGGAETAAAIGKILGVETQDGKRTVALVKCSASNGRVKKKFEYSGIDDCVAAMRLGGGQGPIECPYACVGFGTCVKVCPFDAVHMKDGIARVDPEKCTGCMLCVSACPKHVIAMVPYEAAITVPCNSKEKGAVLRKYCDIGCIACKLCERACEYDAIHVVDNLAQIDYDKCVACGACVAKCPRNIIFDSRTGKEGDEPAPPVVKQDAE
jgi:Na+-translocating ferredoxin:NAD+ oxidoreductase RNF subunit RnfB